MHSVSDLVVTRVISANRLLNSPVGITAFRKSRERWAISLKLKGKTLYTVGGKTVTADSLHPVILPQGCDYYWKCVEPGECCFIEFEADRAAPSLSGFDAFELKDNAPVVAAFTRLEKSLSSGKSYAKQECCGYLYEILTLLLRSAKKEALAPMQSILRPAEKCILENYFDAGLCNERLAALCGISTVYFRKVFTQCHGVSPMRYLHNFRMEKAKSILRSDYDSIGQVATSVGYTGIYHFSKMFRQYTGQSPSEYAKASR